MTGHDGARGLITGTDPPLFVSYFCIFARTFASQMRPGGKQQHSYGEGAFPESTPLLMEDSHHQQQGKTRQGCRAVQNRRNDHTFALREDASAGVCLRANS